MIYFIIKLIPSYPNLKLFKEPSPSPILTLTLYCDSLVTASAWRLLNLYGLSTVLVFAAQFWSLSVAALLSQLLSDAEGTVAYFW